MLLLSVPILLCGCLDQDARRIELRESAILDGELDHGDPAIVYLSMGNSACTGSVIDPRVVLTAKHCVEGVDAGWVEVYSGDNPYGGDGETIARAGDIVDIQVYDDGWSIEGVDIALLIAGSDLGVAPVPYLRDENLPSQGDPVEAAGYGQSDDWSSPDGNKRRGSGSIMENEGVELVTTPITCYGDSGGPLFDADGVVIGITSRGTQDACSAGDDIYTNVGHFAEWIADFVSSPAPLPGDDPVEPDPGDDDPVDPGPDDPGTDPGPGDDDDGTDPGPAPDPGDEPGDDGPIGDGAGFGDGCSEGEQCSSNACVPLEDGEGYCTQSCASTECPYGFECRDSSQGSFCFLDGNGGGGGEGAGPDGYPGLESTCAAAPGSPGGPAGGLALLLTGVLLSLRRRR